MSHVVTVPDIIWKWAQDKSGMSNPASWIRDHCLYATMISDIGGNGEVIHQVESFGNEWAKLGMETNPLDDEFTEALEVFIQHAGGEEKALSFFQEGAKRGIRDPRAYLMSWWYKQKSKTPL